jgi:hypothetical protein
MLGHHHHAHDSANDTALSASIRRLAIPGLVIDYCGTVTGIHPVSTCRGVVWSPNLSIGAAFWTVQQLVQTHGL